MSLMTQPPLWIATDENPNINSCQESCEDGMLEEYADSKRLHAVESIGMDVYLNTLWTYRMATTRYRFLKGTSEGGKACSII